MKNDALDFLICPRCRGGLALETAARDGAEIMEGRLRCAPCGSEYPIRRGVPRFVPLESYAASFGYEWNRFRTVQIDAFDRDIESESTFREDTGWTERDIKSRLVLDAGVGAGRFADVVSRWGGIVVGVDLTRAVDASFATLGRRENVHLVQADLLTMPFRPETFDLAYSIGVLHHTPDTRAAFHRVAAAVKVGGRMAVYVYPALTLARHVSDLIRAVTTRLPLSVLYYASALAVPLYYPLRLPVIGRVLQTLVPIPMHPKWRWRWLDTFDWYTPRYQWKHRHAEVFRWFKESGFADVEVFEADICMAGVKVSGSAA